MGGNVISDRRHEDNMARGAAGIGGSPKRTANRAGLNEDSEDVHGLENARRVGESAGPCCCRSSLMTFESPNYDRMDRYRR